MLQVKTIVKESSIPGAGKGLFADQFIPKGTFVWIWNPIIDKEISTNMLQYMTELEQSYVNKYGYREGNMIYLCSDDGKYFNHSTTPNCIDYYHKTWGGVTETCQDVQKGEELTCDYTTFDDDANKKLGF
jgi:SET domain-containing protein